MGASVPNQFTVNPKGSDGEPAICRAVQIKSGSSMWNALLMNGRRTARVSRTIRTTSRSARAEDLIPVNLSVLHDKLYVLKYRDVDLRISLDGNDIGKRTRRNFTELPRHAEE